MIILKRLCETADGTFGHFIDSKNQPTNIVSLELPWCGNENRKSCIPRGDYHLQKHDSPTKGKVWMLLNVEGRDKIYIHPANVIDQLLGCIAAGSSFGVVAVDKIKVTRFGVSDSKSATARLYALIEKDIDKVLRIL